MFEDSTRFNIGRVLGLVGPSGAHRAERRHEEPTDPSGRDSRDSPPLEGLERPANLAALRRIEAIAPGTVDETTSEERLWNQYIKTIVSQGADPEPLLKLASYKALSSGRLHVTATEMILHLWTETERDPPRPWRRILRRATRRDRDRRRPAIVSPLHQLCKAGDERTLWERCEEKRSPLRLGPALAVGLIAATVDDLVGSLLLAIPLTAAAVSAWLLADCAVYQIVHARFEEGLRVLGPNDVDDVAHVLREATASPAAHSTTTRQLATSSGQRAATTELLHDAVVHGCFGLIFLGVNLLTIYWLVGVAIPTIAKGASVARRRGRGYARARRSVLADPALRAENPDLFEWLASAEPSPAIAALATSFAAVSGGVITFSAPELAFRLAVDEVEGAETSDEETAERLYELAAGVRTLGRPREALSALNQVVRLGDRDMVYRALLDSAEIHAELGESGESARQMRLVGPGTTVMTPSKRKDARRRYRAMMARTGSGEYDYSIFPMDQLDSPKSTRRYRELLERRNIDSERRDLRQSD